jgi:integrase
VKKPDKPSPNFPLFAHATKRWAKKIRGKLHYFGRWDDPQGSLQKYLNQKDDLHAGRIPRGEQQGLAIRDLCNRLLTSKRHRLDRHELSPRTFAEYYAACELIVERFGKDRLVEDLRPDDFERLMNGMPSTWGPVRRGKMIRTIRSVFHYAADEDLVEKPIKFGKQFRPPSKQLMRIHRAKAGRKMFDAVEVRAMVDAASRQLRAMILLAVNCGFGNGDVASLPIQALDLENGWVDFPRPKTGIGRRAKLWPETVAAIREALSARPKPKDLAATELVFVTRCGTAWVRVKTEHQKDGTLKVKCADAVSAQTAKLLKTAGLNGRRNFYCLSHTFETIGGEARDQVAVNAVMGHVDDTMAGLYRERISDERLAAVAEYVRGWLFAEKRIPPVE